MSYNKPTREYWGKWKPDKPPNLRGRNTMFGKRKNEDSLQLEADKRFCTKAHFEPPDNKVDAVGTFLPRQSANTRLKHLRERLTEEGVPVFGTSQPPPPLVAHVPVVNFPEYVPKSPPILQHRVSDVHIQATNTNTSKFSAIQQRLFQFKRPHITGTVEPYIPAPVPLSKHNEPYIPASFQPNRNERPSLQNNRPGLEVHNQDEQSYANWFIPPSHRKHSNSSPHENSNDEQTFQNDDVQQNLHLFESPACLQRSPHPKASVTNNFNFASTTKEMNQPNTSHYNGVSSVQHRLLKIKHSSRNEPYNGRDIVTTGTYTERSRHSGPSNIRNQHPRGNKNGVANIWNKAKGNTSDRLAMVKPYSGSEQSSVILFQSPIETVTESNHFSENSWSRSSIDGYESFPELNTTRKILPSLVDKNVQFGLPPGIIETVTESNHFAGNYRSSNESNGSFSELKTTPKILPSLVDKNVNFGLPPGMIEKVTESNHFSENSRSRSSIDGYESYPELNTTRKILPSFVDKNVNSGLPPEINYRNCMMVPGEAENNNFSAPLEDDMMDWSPIDEEVVISNVEKLRNTDTVKPKPPHTAIQEQLANNCTEIPQSMTLSMKQYIIVDTNIFLSHLNFVSAVLNLKVNGLFPVTVLIPWMVIQELDYIKSNRGYNAALQKNARAAVKFINYSLQLREAKIKGQTVMDALDNQYLCSKNPDDSILNCCLQVQKKGHKAVLLSNDVNLRTKALVNGVPALPHSELFETLDRYGESQMQKEKQVQVEDKKVVNAKTYLSHLCTMIIIKEFKRAYGNVWNKMNGLSTRPPWQIQDCLYILQRYWMTVFENILEKQCLMLIEKFLVFCKNNPCIVEKYEIEKFVELSLSLCVYLKNGVPDDKDDIMECINQIEQVSQLTC